VELTCGIDRNKKIKYCKKKDIVGCYSCWLYPSKTIPELLWLMWEIDLFRVI